MKILIDKENPANGKKEHIDIEVTLNELDQFKSTEKELYKCLVQRITNELKED